MCLHVGAANRYWDAWMCTWWLRGHLSSHTADAPGFSEFSMKHWVHNTCATCGESHTKNKILYYEILKTVETVTGWAIGIGKEKDFCEEESQ